MSVVQPYVQMIDTQKEILLSFMEKHPVLAKGGKIEAEEVQERRRLWQHLAAKLNSGFGPKKSVHQWKRAWFDLKSFRRKKMKARKDTTSVFDMRLIKLLVQEEQGLVAGDAVNDNVKWHLSAAQSMAKQQDDQFPLVLEDPVKDSILPLEEVVTEEHLLKTTPMKMPSTPPSSRSSSSASHYSPSKPENSKKSQRCKKDLSETLLTVTKTLGDVKNHLSSINSSMSDLVDEKRNTNILLNELIQVLKNK